MLGKILLVPVKRLNENAGRFFAFLRGKIKGIIKEGRRCDGTVSVNATAPFLGIV